MIFVWRNSLYCWLYYLLTIYLHFHFIIILSKALKRYVISHLSYFSFDFNLYFISLYISFSLASNWICVYHAEFIQSLNLICFSFHHSNSFLQIVAINFWDYYAWSVWTKFVLLNLSTSAPSSVMLSSFASNLNFTQMTCLDYSHQMLFCWCSPFMLV